MKWMVLISLATIGNIPEYRLFAEEPAKNLMADPDTNRRETTPSKNFDATTPWYNTVYLDWGYGTPQGMRLEAGYYFESYFGFGLTYSDYDDWSSDGNTVFGYFAQIRLPIDSSAVVPYLFLSRRLTIPFLNADRYTLIYVGAAIPVESWLRIRPEIGIALTSRYISGGVNLLGPSTPATTENRTRLGAHISIEVDLRQIFQKVY
ncbi:MAG TPA: hypothetical protein VMM58_06220 [Bacteroidota bacterium]|nr:hypothetical protein [Bacteroidota bacterium]